MASHGLLDWGAQLWEECRLTRKRKKSNIQKANPKGQRAQIRLPMLWIVEQEKMFRNRGTWEIRDTCIQGQDGRGKASKTNKHTYSREWRQIEIYLAWLLAWAVEVWEWWTGTRNRMNQGHKQLTLRNNDDPKWKGESGSPTHLRCRRGGPRRAACRRGEDGKGKVRIADNRSVWPGITDKWDQGKNCRGKTKTSTQIRRTGENQRQHRTVGNLGATPPRNTRAFFSFSLY